MLNQIKGLHHVTSLAADARSNNRFFTDVPSCAASRRPSISTIPAFITSIMATKSARPAPS